MTPREFFEEVAGENARRAVESRGDLRRAINAIMTLDAFFGVLHAELLSKGIIAEADDSCWKDTIAKTSDDCRLVRDAAFALKHGELRGRRTRVVTKPEQLVTMPAAFDPNVFQRNAFQTQGMVWIDAPDNDYRADVVIKAVSDLACQESSCMVINGLKLKPVAAFNSPEGLATLGRAPVPPPRLFLFR